MSSATENHEKQRAALLSITAGIGMTAFKIIVAVMTGSLALLAESAHSGLDLISALVTYIAVRISGKPADTSHHFGHGKFENLSAFIEMILVVGTGVGILYEAIQRLFFRAVSVDASVWAFIVMGVSIVIDYSRVQVLSDAANKYNSQALEADALNYRNDMYSSIVTILGLALVRVSQIFNGLSFLAHADSIAALGLTVIILRAGVKLGIQAAGELLDRAPDIPAEQIIAAVEAIPGVVNVHQVRLRASGPDYFIDIHATMPANITLGEAHRLMDRIEERVRQIIPGADVDVHPEPADAAASKPAADTPAASNAAADNQATEKQAER